MLGRNARRAPGGPRFQSSSARGRATMKQLPFSLILLPTLGCDADCDYCFEKKSGLRLTPAQLTLVISKGHGLPGGDPFRHPGHLLAGGRSDDPAARMV